MITDGKTLIIVLLAIISLVSITLYSHFHMKVVEYRYYAEKVEEMKKQRIKMTDEYYKAYQKKDVENTSKYASAAFNYDIQRELYIDSITNLK